MSNQLGRRPRRVAKLPPELCGKEPRGLVFTDAVDQLTDCLGCVPVGGDTKQGFVALIVEVRLELIARRLSPVFEVMSGPCPGHSGDLCFGEHPVADRVELHQLTGKILLLKTRNVGGIIEVDEHRSTERDRLEQRFEGAKPVFAELRVLVAHVSPVANPISSARKMAMPEVHQLLDEGCRRAGHDI